MNVLYCGDKNIKDGLFLSVMSITKQIKEPLHIYIMTMRYDNAGKVFLPLEESFCERLRDYVTFANRDSSVTLIDCGSIFLSQPPNANLDTRFTPYCMLRLFADKVSLIPDRVLYLDTDVLCINDPAEFYNQNIDGIELCGVLDRYGSWFFRNNIFKRDYLNSGVLLFNMRRIRENGLFAKCRERCAERKMFMPDQTALHKLCKEKKILPRKFNEQKNETADTVFRHFTTFFKFFPYIHSVSVKPWQTERMHEVLKNHAYDDLINEYTSLRDTFERNNDNG